ncbi:uncharacterized protein LOC118198442 isoform X2 [Stegodyphus dumicola]|uniref:uncharacterized protein LOC118198442 isoform X2 n=1 Tax=Stegodyphus dumicola TaxID=202533 RepID=UPI0015ACE5E6|nr:uncharacterized protein LOC118198442 isoform X2 [Stegodyphus dumicola]
MGAIRKMFIEDQEMSFKFHPWQMTSLLSKIRENIHNELPERAIHHLWDTGVANEILNVSNQNTESDKVQKVKHYLCSYLDIHIYQVSYPECIFANNSYAVESLLTGSKRNW